MLRNLFISRDDYDGDIINPLSMNKYAYCEENPLKYKDPSGNIPLNIAGIVIGAGGGAKLGIAVADHYKLTGYKRKLTIAGFAVGGAAIGWFAGPVVKELALKIAVKMQVTSWGIKGTGEAVKLPSTSFTTSRLQHEFKHAGDFGITGNWNKAIGEVYKKAIQNHINTATNIYKSTYRGQNVYVYISKNTGIGAYTDLLGNYIGGWKFSSDQLHFHITNGIKIK